jgi:hypothetical protein
MVLFDLLQMTKTKILVLALLLVAFSPSFINLSCIVGAGECGFLLTEFFVTFVWMYIISCLIIELALFIRKKIRKVE